VSPEVPHARRAALVEVVQQVIVHDLKVRVAFDQIQPDTPLFGTGLGLDSIDAVDLAIGIERRAGVRLPDDARGRAALRTVNQLVDLLLQLQPASVSGAEDVG
jgi:acyl carrier protein